MRIEEPFEGTPSNRRFGWQRKRGLFSDYLAKRRIPNLDGLRGLAILLVLAHHIPAAQSVWINQLQQNGKHGVSLFFVISGYIVMTLLLREFRQSSRINVRGFLWRRLLRLWPLYYLILLSESALVFIGRVYSPENQTLFAENFVCYALYCSNWLETSGQGPFFVAWSLAVEEQFYLLLSLMLLFLRPAQLVAAFVGLLALKVLLIHGPVGIEPVELPWRILLSYSEAIILGVLLAYFLNESKRFTSFLRFADSRIAKGVLISVLALFLVFGQLDEKSDVATLFFYCICTLLVGVCATQERLPIIGGRILSRVGLLSYGIYLMHMPVLSVVKKVTADPAIVMVLTLASVIPMAWLSFTFFEAPIRRLGKKNHRLAAENVSKKPVASLQRAVKVDAT